MKVTELVTELENLNIPLAYHSFEEYTAPPFLIYLDTDSDNFGADDVVYHEVTNIDIELYTEIVDDQLEKQLKDVLTAANLYYDWSRVYIKEEKVYKTTFEVSLL
ncbi:hypothetical protein AAGS61_08525 [Lysinibacillus sp. KU-BSD001]|uniref:hypothetical protein n=1 Tax=Lysinibacillus sp. KU-BSD001 TaxID=3141328 RepID=UPI0036E9079F